MLSLAESILENPEVILRAQINFIKSELIAELKEQGVEYDDRMERLEEVEHPKPEADFIYATFNEFAATHPWVGQENIRPKSIAREMYERYSSFADYVKRYGIQRAEGLLLRHITQVYRVLENTIPPAFKTEPVEEMISYFNHLLRHTDSSLMDEWETLRNPDYVKGPAGAELPDRPDITRDAATLERAVRTAVFAFLHEFANREWEALVESYSFALCYPDAQSPEIVLRRDIESYFEDHDFLRFDPEARSKKHTRIDRDDRAGMLRVEQTLVDGDELNDVQWVFQVDLKGVRESGVVALLPIALERTH